VVPIAAAYEVAHNYPYVLRNAAALLDLSLAPLGLASGVEPLAWLSVPAFWGSQVVLVVFGHVVGVVAAHRVAVSRYGDRGIRAHLPLVVLMVGYTVLSLWVVSQPVVA
jgi:Zn-dependent protease